MLNYVELRERWSESLLRLFAIVNDYFDENGDVMPAWLVMSGDGQLHIIKGEMPDDPDHKEKLAAMLRGHFKEIDAVAYCSALEVWHVRGVKCEEAEKMGSVAAHPDREEAVMFTEESIWQDAMVAYGINRDGDRPKIVWDEPVEKIIGNHNTRGRFVHLLDRPKVN